jgi:hypothetical protein
MASMANRRVNHLSEQQAEAGRKSKYLQNRQVASDASVSYAATSLHEVMNDGNSAPNLSTGMLAKSAGLDYPQN